ncbi:hypothetical protein ABEB36_003092 [Hypothenemus hampei]|uniref:Transmembrane protein 43 n=1 Tax=Hypothenemus hampei TaxID=57062 RepID=A0ABD1F803_HYPHA
MQMTFQEEFQRSWLTSILGFLIFVVGVYLLVWNEGEIVHHHHSLEETFNNAITLNPFEKLQPEYEGRVVHIMGDLKVDEPLTELEYGISIQAVKLKRRVQMYQWVEEQSSSNVNDETDYQSTRDYYYVTEWRDKLVDSSSFYIRTGHENPTQKPLETVIYTAPSVRLGPLTLNSEIKDKFTEFEEVTSDERPDRPDVKLHLGIYYHCKDVWNPEVGDIRIQFYYAGPTGEPITIIAKQEKNILVPYTTSKGHQVALLRNGNLNIDEMFRAEHWDVKVSAWKLRIYGAFLIYFGVICWSKLLKLIFNQIPMLTDIISGEAIDGRNCFLAGSIALFVIALAWVLHRPVLGMSLIFVAVSPLLYGVTGVYGGPPN